MPTYDFRCDTCNKCKSISCQMEERHNLRNCECGGILEKIPSKPNVITKTKGNVVKNIKIADTHQKEPTNSSNSNNPNQQNVNLLTKGNPAIKLVGGNFKFIETKFTNCYGALSIAKNTKLELKENKFENVGKPIEVRKDEPSQE